MNHELTLKILAEIAAPGSVHLFSRREAARSAIALIEQQAARIAELEAQIATVAPAVDAQPVAIRLGDDTTVTNVPARIYLNLGDPYEMGEIQFQQLTDVTWCEDQIDDTDIEYVRADTSAQSEGLRKDALDALLAAEDALSRCYDVTEWPCNGETPQDAALATVRAALSQHTGEKDD
jgi:hypothetical protein